MITATSGRVRTASATAHFPSSDTYFSYQYQRSQDRIRLHFTGTGEHVSFRILLPGWRECSGVTLDGEEAEFQVESLEESVYVTIASEIKGVNRLVVDR